MVQICGDIILRRVDWCWNVNGCEWWKMEKIGTGMENDGCVV